MSIAAAIKDYVDNNAGDGQLLRASFTANSSDNTFNIGTVPKRIEEVTTQVE